MPKKQAAGTKQAAPQFDRAGTSGQYVLQTPAMADQHASLLSRCEYLTQRIFNLMQREVLDVETETFSTGFASRSTVGVMLADKKIDNLVHPPALVAFKPVTQPQTSSTCKLRKILQNKIFAPFLVF